MLPLESELVWCSYTPVYWVSKLSMHQNDIAGLLDTVCWTLYPQSLWFNRLGVKLKLCISHKFPSDDDDAHMEDTLWRHCSSCLLLWRIHELASSVFPDAAFSFPLFVYGSGSRICVLESSRWFCCKIEFEKHYDRTQPHSSSLRFCSHCHWESSISWEAAADCSSSSFTP